MIACKMPSELPDYRELNRRFHAGIFTASRRSYLIRTLAQLWAAFPTMLWSNIPRVARASTPARDATDNDEHEAIVRALTARDPEAAEEALRRHVEAAGRDLVSAMKGED
jgi:DNA-binding GntR family transcriptional regulator